MLETPPVPVTWERFHREISCQGVHSEGPDHEDAELRLRKSYEALAGAAEGAVCRTHSDCSVRYLWPEYGPSCLAVGRQWEHSQVYRKTPCDFDFDDGECRYGCPVPCEAVCVRARCKIKGQESLLDLTPEQLRCARGEVSIPKAPAEPGPFPNTP